MARRAAAGGRWLAGWLASSDRWRAAGRCAARNGSSAGGGDNAQIAGRARRRRALLAGAAGVRRAASGITALGVGGNGGRGLVQIGGSAVRVRGCGLVSAGGCGRAGGRRRRWCGSAGCGRATASGRRAASGCASGGWALRADCWLRRRGGNSTAALRRRWRRGGGGGGATTALAGARCVGAGAGQLGVGGWLALAQRRARRSMLRRCASAQRRRRALQIS